jgi:hypothetical protein
MKTQEYARIHAAIDAADFLHSTKEDQKARLDVWIGDAVRAAINDGPISSWEMQCFRESISDSYSGLFWGARNAIYNATLPGAPGLNWPEGLHRELAEITPDMLLAAVEQLRHCPARLQPVFRWQ